MTIPNLTAANYDMIGSGASGTGTITNPANPGLGTLGNQGGPVATIPLVSGSPASGTGAAVEGLAGALNSTTTTTFTVPDATLFAATPMLPLPLGSFDSLSSGSYYTIQIGNEQMAVTSLNFGYPDDSGYVIGNGDSGYVVGDQLTVTGGTLAPGGTPTVLTVSSVNAGAIAGLTLTSPGSYTTSPIVNNGAASLTGGSGSGAQIYLNYVPVGIFSVIRGVNGTTPATHPANASIYLVSDAREAVLLSTGTPSINMGAVNSAVSKTLSWEQQPTDTAVGATINPVPAVLVESGGVPQVGVTITITISSGTLNGTLTGSTNSAGILTFNSLSVPTATNNLTLTATATGYTSATSIPFDVTALPSVTLVSPSFGSIQGGTTVTITGTNFVGATAVSFGSTAATSFTVISSTQIDAVAPAESAGTVNVTVTTPTGSSPISTSDRFSFLTAIVVTTVSDAVSHTGTSLRDAIATAGSDAAAGQSDVITFASNLTRLCLEPTDA